MRSNRIFRLVTILLLAAIMSACSGRTGEQAEKEAHGIVSQTDDPMKNKGVGSVTHVELGELDPVLAGEGKQIFDRMCTACHKSDEKFIGPAPKGIFDRRSPEWIMNMILSPEKMVQQDPVAKKLLVEYNLAPMANQNLTEDQARKILEYFRTLE